MSALNSLAAMEAYKNNPTDAMLQMRQALAIAVGPREALLALPPRQVTLVKGVAFRQMVDILLKQGKPEEAFLWAERAKGIYLHDMLIDAGCEPT